MNKKTITVKEINAFKKALQLDEKSTATIEKYTRDVTSFMYYLNENAITKETTIEYKAHLLDMGYSIRSVNSIIASLNSFFTFFGWYNFKLKSIKVQRSIYCSKEKEITKAEYIRLIQTAYSKGNTRLGLIIETLGATGIRISELQFITVEAVNNNEAIVFCKNKMRRVFIVEKLKKKLLRYIASQQIKSGCIFVTRTGKPMNRCNIWREMKGICEDANINPKKVFPHNLRHLFARAFYSIEKDIAKLADVLGHSSINTTRIYIITSGEEHRRHMENIRLII